MPTDQRKIVFVDDEVNVLQGLRRSLHALRSAWDMHFFDKPEDALGFMDESGAPDIVVSDMRMPGMDGVEFLGEVMRRHPQTVRFALSGQVESDMLVRAYSVTHQFLNKPFDAQDLERHVARAFALRDHLGTGELNKKLMSLGGIPSMPMACQTIRRELLSDSPDLDAIAAAVEQDPGLSTKVLQIVNSSFLGLRHHIGSIKQACTLLGMGNIQNIVLLGSVVNIDEKKRLPRGAGLDSVWTDSLRLALYAQAIAREEGQPKPAQDDAYTAGLLHGVGKVLLVTELTDDFTKAFNHAQEKKISLMDAEREIFGSTHAEIGAYLLELWGIPAGVCRAIAFYDKPSACPPEICEQTDAGDFSTLTALHIAHRAANDADLDTTYLASVNSLDKADAWIAACKAVEPEEK